MRISSFIPYPVVGSRTIVNNAGATEITGLQLEIIAQPMADLNIMLTYGYPDGDYQESLELAQWTKNLTDEEYRTHGIDFGAFGYSGNYFGNPRTYAAYISYRF